MLAPSVHRRLRYPVLLGSLGRRSGVGIAQELHDLFIDISGLVHNAALGAIFFRFNGSKKRLAGRR